MLCLFGSQGCSVCGPAASTANFLLLLQCVSESLIKYSCMVKDLWSQPLGKRAGRLTCCPGVTVLLGECLSPSFPSTLLSLPGFKCCHPVSSSGQGCQEPLTSLSLAGSWTLSRSPDFFPLLLLPGCFVVLVFLGFFFLSHFDNVKFIYFLN